MLAQQDQHFVHAGNIGTAVPDGAIDARIMQDEFRRLWLSIHGVRRYVERNGNSLTPEEWIRKEEWGRRADRPRS